MATLPGQYRLRPFVHEVEVMSDVEEVTSDREEVERSVTLLTV
jgi:hypothetical protein